MKIALLSRNQKLYSTRRLLEAARARGHDVQVVDVLRAYMNIAALVYEAGEALRFDELSVRGGVDGILNVMSHLGMIRKRRPRKAPTPLIAKSTQWVRAPQSGVMRSPPSLGARVAAGERLALIGDPFGDHEEEVLSPAAGIVIGRTRVPLVHEGEALFYIAKFDQTSRTAESIENFQDAFDPNNGSDETTEPPLS